MRPNLNIKCTKILKKISMFIFIQRKILFYDIISKINYVEKKFKQCIM